MTAKKAIIMLAWTGLVYIVLLTGNFSNVNPLVMFAAMSISWFIGLYAISKLADRERNSDIP
jgi:hypothetical protein